MNGLADAYLNTVIASYTPNHSIPIVAATKVDLDGRVTPWAKGLLLETKISGSYAKGTAIIGGTDVDFFLSFSEQCTDDLSGLYSKVLAFLNSQYGIARRQDVSIGTRINNLAVDVTPGKRQNASSSDHSIYSNRRQTWTKTNVDKHVRFVQDSNGQPIIRLMKIWRNQKGLDFPSFLLELITIQSFSTTRSSLAGWLLGALQFVADKIETATILDPANASNIVSNTLTAQQKTLIAQAAKTAIGSSNWNQVVRPR